MKFVALVSGGKDSCFNAMECVRHGHELVCLANLYPAPAAPSEEETASDEADSFMYQSAGHTAIGAQAECFGKPLVRRQISGRALNQSLQYLPTEEDEVEDLYLLLRDVKERFREVKGVASGAILSNYQRTRVENVCERLGLTSLAYLWRRPQSTLLGEMVDAGVDAVLVKVASFGLEPSKHLGKSLARLRPYFASLHERCGFHVCGEGGEYETLTLDCPLFVRRLVLDETMVMNHSDDMFAPVGLLRVVKCHSEPKETLNCGNHGDAGNQTPDKRLQQGEGGSSRRIEGNGASAQTGVGGRTFERPGNNASISDAQTASTARKALAASFLPHVHEGSGGLVYLSSVRATGMGPLSPGLPISAVAQARHCLSCVQAALESTGVSMRDVCFVHLYLRDMGHFAEINGEYCRWFEGVNPPSRSCVAVPLPPGYLVMLDLVALRGSGEALLREGAACTQRQVLHVRSISTWAPVCIGPYCQANTLAPGNAIVLIAGQIGLQPASMILPPRTPFFSASRGESQDCSGFVGEMAGMMVGEELRLSPSSFHGAELRLCVSHASAVASAVGASLSRGCVFATLYVSQEAAESAVAAGLGGELRVEGKDLRKDKVEEEGNPGGSCGREEMQWLQCMVEECRRLMEARFGQEEAEARAEAAGRGDGWKGDDNDSAEEGWTSDPEELAKEASRKMVLSRRLPILPVMVPSLPKNSAVELEVLCMSRAALSLLPCKYYPPSTRHKTFAQPPARESACTVPALFALLLQASECGKSSGGSHDEAKTTVISVTTSGSTVDGILCVLGSSVSVLAGAVRHPGDEVNDTCITSAIPPNANVNEGIADGCVTRGTCDERRRVSETEAGQGSTAVRGEPRLREIPALGGVALSGARLERALALALEGISEAMSSARLKWRDVSHLRVYYRCHVVRRDGWSSSGVASWAEGGGREDCDGGGGYGDEEELLKRAMHLALASATPERPAITFVPVNALEAVEDIVNIHTTAWNLDRLRTELWVRGAP